VGTVSILKLPVRALDAVADRAAAAFGAVLFLQVPGFISHYLQRLAGHAAEAQRNVDGWMDIAAKCGLSDVVQLAARYRSTGAVEVVATGDKCLADLARLQRLTADLAAIRDAPVWKRGIEFITHADAKIVRGTWSDYTFNLPVNLESLAYALVGVVVSLCVYSLAKLTLGGVLRAMARRHAKDDVSVR